MTHPNPNGHNPNGRYQVIPEHMQKRKADPVPCIKCGGPTHQLDHVCVPCDIGITPIQRKNIEKSLPAEKPGQVAYEETFV